MKKYLLFLLIYGSIHSFAQKNDLHTLVMTLLSETPIEEDLQELCDHIGGRVTGSEANKAAVEWGLTKFEAAGVSVRKQAFEMPVLWLEKATNAQISGAINFVPKVVAKYQSPPADYEGQLIYMGYGTADDFKSKGDLVKDQFILVENDLCLDIDGLLQNMQRLLLRKCWH